MVTTCKTIPEKTYIYIYITIKSRYDHGLPTLYNPLFKYQVRFFLFTNPYLNLLPNIVFHMVPQLVHVMGCVRGFKQKLSNFSSSFTIPILPKFSSSCYHAYMYSLTTQTYFFYDDL